MGKYHQYVNSQWLSSGLFCLSQGIGTDEDTLIEILASRNNREILDIKKAYQEGSVQIVSIIIQLVFVTYWDHGIHFYTRDANVVVFLVKNTKRTWRKMWGLTLVEISGLFFWKLWRLTLQFYFKVNFWYWSPETASEFSSCCYRLICLFCSYV